MKRRELLKQVGLAAGVAAIGGFATASPGQKNKRKRVLRIAHITDVHIRPEENAPGRFTKCLEEIKKHKVDFFLNGGDSILAADYNDISRERVNELWSVWHETTKAINGFASANEGKPATGYQLYKGHNTDYFQQYAGNVGTTAQVIFRYAEVLLNFAEAKAELGTITQDDVDKSINKLRQRVGMPNLSIARHYN